MGSMTTYTPVSPARLVQLIADAALALPGPFTTVVVDGADAADPLALAHAVMEAVRADGRFAAVVDLHDFVFPASIRFEYGREDEQSYRERWFDLAALRPEVLEPWRASGRWLPRLWDEASDRSARAPGASAPGPGVLIVAGPLLLANSTEADLRVALRMSPAALHRKTPADQHFTVSLLETREPAEFVVGWDHPEHPTLISDER